MEQLEFSNLNKFVVIAQIVHSAHKELCKILGNDNVAQWSELTAKEKNSIVDSVIFRTENPHAVNPQWCYKEVESKMPSSHIIGSMFGSIVDGIHEQF